MLSFLQYYTDRATRKMRFIILTVLRLAGESVVEKAYVLLAEPS